MAGTTTRTQRKRNTNRGASLLAVMSIAAGRHTVGIGGARAGYIVSRRATLLYLGDEMGKLIRRTVGACHGRESGKRVRVCPGRGRVRLWGVS